MRNYFCDGIENSLDCYVFTYGTLKTVSAADASL